MLKPIVSMNQMAMNESIATTCCYKWNGVSVTGSATVLHGGKLDVNYHYGYYYPETNETIKVSNGWMNVAVVPNYEYKERVMSSANLPYLCGGDWYDGDAAITKWGGIELTDAGKVAWKIKDPSSYYKKVLEGYDITHKGATSAHYKWTSGNNWLADHTAVQYSS